MTHGVEKLGTLHGKQQEDERVVGQRAKRVLREPDRVGQADQDGLIGADQRQRAEDRVAQARRLRLHDVADVAPRRCAPP